MTEDQRVTRERRDVAAAAWWAAADDPDVERLTAYLQPDELVLNIVQAWFKSKWGVLAVTTKRVLMVSTNDADGGDSGRMAGYAYEIPVEGVIGVGDGGVSESYHIAQLQDYESWTKVFMNSKISVEGCHQRVYWNVRKLMRAGADTLEQANDRGVLDEFRRFQSIMDAHKAGGLDVDAMRAAVVRMFPVADVT